MSLKGFLLTERCTSLGPHYDCPVLPFPGMNVPISHQLTPKLFSMTGSDWLCPGSCHTCSYSPLYCPYYAFTQASAPIQITFLCSAHPDVPEHELILQTHLKYCCLLLNLSWYTTHSEEDSPLFHWGHIA